MFNTLFMLPFISVLEVKPLGIVLFVILGLVAAGTLTSCVIMFLNKHETLSNKAHLFSLIISAILLFIALILYIIRKVETPIVFLGLAAFLILGSISFVLRKKNQTISKVFACITGVFAVCLFLLSFGIYPASVFSDTSLVYSSDKNIAEPSAFVIDYNMSDNYQMFFECYNKETV